MARVLVLYYSTYGHTETLADAIAEGARSTGAVADVKRVPETVPEDIARSNHFKLDQAAPIARVSDLEEYDAIVIGTGTRYGRITSQMAAFLDQKPLFGANGTVTAGNASGINDGAAAMIVASEAAAHRYGLTPRARILGMASIGVEPRVMGIGPLPATLALLSRLRLGIGDFDAIELNEAFASQSLAVMRGLGLPDDAPEVNANGGAIALGHPLGMSGARLALTLVHQLERSGGRRGLATLCIGVGMGLALAVERV